MTLSPFIAPNAPSAIGPYSHGVVASGTFVFLSGQIALLSDGTLASGTITEQTRQVFANIKVILEAKGLSLQHVVKTTVFLTDMNNFGEMNTVYAEEFAGHKPARSAIEVSALPKGAAIEIEVIACA